MSAIMMGSRANQEALIAFKEANRLRSLTDSVSGFDEADKGYAHANTGAFDKVVIAMEQRE